MPKASGWTTAGHVVSLCDAGGDPLATAEIVLGNAADAERGIRVEQVRGWQNREPSPDTAAVFEAFVAGMRDGSLPMDRAALEATPAAHLMHRQRITAGATPGWPLSALFVESEGRGRQPRLHYLSESPRGSRARRTTR